MTPEEWKAWDRYRYLISTGVDEETAERRAFYEAETEAETEARTSYLRAKGFDR